MAILTRPQRGPSDAAQRMTRAPPALLVRTLCKLLIAASALCSKRRSKRHLVSIVGALDASVDVRSHQRT